jgi:hypothetical protein
MMQPLHLNGAPGRMNLGTGAPTLAVTRAPRARLPSNTERVGWEAGVRYGSLRAWISALAPTPSVLTNDTWCPRVVMLSSWTAKPML